MRIPFVDLKWQVDQIRSDLDADLLDILENSLYVRGPYVNRFEKEFAQEIQSNNCISTANGTDSLFIAMQALGVARDQEVIVPAQSWISTSETVSLCGARPVFCDTTDQGLIDINKLEKCISQRTVGIIPVHLYGRAVDMDKICAFASHHDLWVLEDCAQAHKACWKGKQVGTFGSIGSFSFYPGKNLGALGDAGAVVTNEQNIAEYMAMFARHGGLVKGQHLIEGVNSRLDGIQAAVLLRKLKYLDDWNNMRREIARRYSNLLAGLPIELPKHPADASEHVWHLYVIKTEHRDALAHFLKEKNVSTVINYPVSLPFLPAYKSYGFSPDDFPQALSNQGKILSLPIYPGMNKQQIQYVADSVSEFFLSYDNK